ncbi:MAG: DUF2937 family protein [Desulforegulaceae bacterium]|nr:DUF2937 family protein [Desulforegulaceae bacterium]
MKTIAQYLRLILFLGGILVGVQIPGFMNAYHNSLLAHLNESEKSLGHFQKDADKYFNGNLDSLITHYKINKDPVFTEGGKSIDLIYQRNLLLNKAFSDFNKNFFNAFVHVFIKPVKDIKKEVLKAYSYSLRLDKTSIIAGLLSGTILAGLPEIIFLIFFKFVKRNFY